MLIMVHLYVHTFGISNNLQENVDTFMLALYIQF